MIIIADGTLKLIPIQFTEGVSSLSDSSWFSMIGHLTNKMAKDSYRLNNSSLETA